MSGSRIRGASNAVTQLHCAILQATCKIMWSKCKLCSRNRALCSLHKQAYYAQNNARLKCRGLVPEQPRAFIAAAMAFAVYFQPWYSASPLAFVHIPRVSLWMHARQSVNIFTIICGFAVCGWYVNSAVSAHTDASTALLCHYCLNEQRSILSGYKLVSIPIPSLASPRWREANQYRPVPVSSEKMGMPRIHVHMGMR